MDNRPTIQEYQDEDCIRLEELESELKADIEIELANLEDLFTEREKIGSPDNLGETVKNIVWEQFINQIGVMAGEDFVKENRGLSFDPRTQAHVQTGERFAKGEIAKHNRTIDYQKRYDDWKNNFQLDEDGNIKMKVNPRSGKEQPVLTETARKRFDDTRPKGSKTVNLDHTIPVAEGIRDPRTNAFMSPEEQISFFNGDSNLNPLDSAANQSKSDRAMQEWLESTRNGETPDQRFGLDKEELLEKDKKSREEWEKEKQKGEELSKETGKESQRQEIIEMGGQALRAALMVLLADLVRKIINKLVKWFKSAERTVKTLIQSIKSAVKDFIQNLKETLLTAFDIALTAVVEAIIGPIAGIIRSTVRMMKQGWSSLKEAVDYIKNPENKNKPIDILIMEVGKIVIAGSTAAGAIALSEAISKGLSTIPVFAFNIPLLGSLANIIGIFMGAVVAGILGAIAINQIDKALAQAKLRVNTEQIITHGNAVLAKQGVLLATDAVGISVEKAKSGANITERHNKLASVLSETETGIKNHSETTEIDRLQNESDELLSDIFDSLNS